MLKIQSWAELEALVRARIPEGQTVEYKEALPLSTRSARVEFLKDLSGMGNGGGGTVLFGVAEAASGEADHLAAFGDRSIIDVIENIVATSIRPPRLWTFRVLEREEGIVLVADVRPSSLGPYMVVAYDQFRYFRRQGRSTRPMAEQEVRDAYALATRVDEARRLEWERHGLPPAPPTSSPWLTLSAHPEGPAVEFLDLTRIDLRQFQNLLPDNLHANAARIAPSTQSIFVWADGLFGEDRWDENRIQAFVRVHRAGAIAAGLQLGEEIELFHVRRALNGQLLFAVEVWEKLEMARPVTLQARVENLGRASVAGGMFRMDRVQARRPAGAPEPAVVLEREVLAADLLRPQHRNRLVLDFADRLAQAFGRQRHDLMFRVGWLYGRSEFLRLSVAGSGMWDEHGNLKAYYYSDTSIRRHFDYRLVGFLLDGVLVDEHGDTLAVLEFAFGSGVPEGFRLDRAVVDARARVPSIHPGTPLNSDSPLTPPTPTGRWSETDINTLLQP